MGEIADAIIDRMLDGHWINGPYSKSRRKALSKICKYCGKENLRWGNIKGGFWRLHYKNGELHSCL